MQDATSTEAAGQLLDRGFTNEQVRSLTAQQLILMLRNRDQLGTKTVLLLIAEALTPEQERRWNRYLNAQLRFVLEKTWMSSENAIISRGNIVEEILRGIEYAFKTELELDYPCPDCQGEGSVLSFTKQNVFCRCRRCQHEFLTLRKAEKA